MATRLVDKLVRSSVTRTFVKWECPVKAGKFHIGPSKEAVT